MALLHAILDGCCLGRRKTGNETYLRSLLQGFDEIASPDLHLTVLTTPCHQGVRQPRFTWHELPVGNFLTRNFFSIPKILASSAATSFYHATYWTRFWSNPRPSIVMIHDLSFVSFPQGFKTHERLVYANLIRATARQAKHILTVSEFSKQDLMEKWQLPAEKITVTYEAVESCFQPRENHPASTSKDQAPYILYVGNLHPRKNLVRLLQAFVQLKEQQRCPHRLKIVGQKAWLFGDIFDAMRHHRLEKEVDFTGYVSQEELVRLYQGATVAAYPSLFEGFGFPVLEAMACGCPVVTSKTTSLPEVAGSAAVLINPESAQEIADGLWQVLSSSDRRQDLQRRGLEQVKKFSWTRCARETLGAYRHLHNS